MFLSTTTSQSFFPQLLQLLTSAVEPSFTNILVAREAQACEVFDGAATALCIGNACATIRMQYLATFTFTVEPRNLIHTDLAAVAIADKALIVV